MYDVLFQVGYCIRFDDCSDPKATRIKVSCQINEVSVLFICFIGCHTDNICSLPSVSYRRNVSKRNDERPAVEEVQVRINSINYTGNTAIRLL